MAYTNTRLCKSVWTRLSVNIAGLQKGRSKNISCEKDAAPKRVGEKKC